jgi:predicted DNA-binding helix-hairpin-helix protein
MSIWSDVKALSAAAQHEICCADRKKSPGEHAALGRHIRSVALPGGKRVPLLKLLMSNVCENDCLYCANRRGRDFARTVLQPEELARAFWQLHRKGMAQGLFLSSGIDGSSFRTMERMIAAADLLRSRYGFRGYIHLKVLPGVTRDYVERAIQLAQRVSVNLEAPNRTRLAGLAPSKRLQGDLLRSMRWIRELQERQARRGGSPVSQTTQFVVGAAGESDRELLRSSSWLYRKLELGRVYYSAFHPVPETPLQDVQPADPMREHRLYQADFLLRSYGFVPDEMVFDPRGRLPLDVDPKLAWAKSHPGRFPLEINRAPLHELLRVPGIGPRSATRIIELRHKEKIRSLAALAHMGAVSRRAAPFLLLDGRRPLTQQSFW